MVSDCSRFRTLEVSAVESVLLVIHIGPDDLRLSSRGLDLLLQGRNRRLMLRLLLLQLAFMRAHDPTDAVSAFMELDSS